MLRKKLRDGSINIIESIEGSTTEISCTITPNFLYGALKLPVGPCDELQKMMNNFLWGSKRDG